MHESLRVAGSLAYLSSARSNGESTSTTDTWFGVCSTATISMMGNLRGVWTRHDEDINMASVVMSSILTLILTVRERRGGLALFEMVSSFILLLK